MTFLLVRQTQQTLLQILMTMSKRLLPSAILSFLLLSRRQSVLPLSVLLHQATAVVAVATMAVAAEEEPLLLVPVLLLQLLMLQAIPDLPVLASVLLGFLTSSLTLVLVPSMATPVTCTIPGATLPTRALLSLA